MSGNIEALNLNVEEEAKNAKDFSALPEGEYQVVITDSEMKENKSGQGSHVACTLQVIEGDFEGRLLWANFNVQNANPTAEKIGRGELAACCKAMGIANPKATEDLKDIPFKVKVGLDKKDPTQNKIKAYIALDGAPVATPEKAKEVAKPAASTKKPWQRATK